MVRRVLLLATWPVLAAAASPEFGAWSRSIEGRAVSRFVHHGVERAAESWQPAAWLANGPVRLGTWMSFPTNDTRSHEFALVAAGRHEWDSGFALEAEVVHYHLRDARNGHPGHTAELTVAASAAVGSGRVTVAVLRDVKRRGELLRLAYSGEQALTRIGAFLRYRFEVGAKQARDVLPNLPGAPVGDGYSYATLAGELPYRVGEAWVVTLASSGSVTKGQRPFWSPIAAPVRAKLAFSLGATWEF